METPRASRQQKVTGKFRNIVQSGWGAQDGVRKGQGEADDRALAIFQNAGRMHGQPEQEGHQGARQNVKKPCVPVLCCSIDIINLVSL